MIAVAVFALPLLLEERDKVRFDLLKRRFQALLLVNTANSGFHHSGNSEATEELIASEGGEFLGVHALAFAQDPLPGE